MKTLFYFATLALCVTYTPLHTQAQGVLDKPLDALGDPLQHTLPELRQYVESNVERSSTGTLEDTAEATTGALPMELPTELTMDLPTKLPVLTTGGEVAFVEVTVENGYRAIEREWLLTVNKAQLAALEALDVDILEHQSLTALGLTTLRIRVPSSADSREAIQALLPSATPLLDRNHVYAPQADGDGPAPAADTVGPSCRDALKLGMIDTAIHTRHPAFGGREIIQQSFLSAEARVPSSHGTAVAGQLLGKGANLSPLLPNARLYNASVFYTSSVERQGATVNSLLQALNWLAEQQVAVINMSLAGPPNALLEAAVQALYQQQIVVVAAAGNAGPAAPPLYPAAYPEVVAVTAVDNRKQIYRWANRGEHIDFAARGVSVSTARGDSDFGRESGTSMAAPVVSARLACILAINGSSAAEAVKRLAATAEDLGEAGRDPTFGDGLLYRY